MRTSWRAALMVMPLLVVMPHFARAQIFSCRDSAGRTLTSDRPIPECASRDMRELGKNGVVKRIISAPLTAEQRRAKELDEERSKQQADAALEARRRDQALLARFHNEGEIDRAHQRAISDIQEKINQSNRAIGLASSQLTNAETEAAKRADKSFMPPYLQQRMDEAKMMMGVESKHMHQYRDQLSQVDRSFDDTLKRYRELVQGSASK